VDVLDSAVADIEAHVHHNGWDQPPTLFALVRADQFTRDDPQTAARMGIDKAPADTLTFVEQDQLPDTPLDEFLASVAWPDSVTGCVLTQEVVILPPEAENELSDDDIADRALEHPDRREARLVVGVLRDGATATVLRIRSDTGGEGEDDLLTGAEMAPNLVEALLATFE
jgi:hypothetical protein